MSSAPEHKNLSSGENPKHDTGLLWPSSVQSNSSISRSQIIIEQSELPDARYISLFENFKQLTSSLWPS